MELRRQSPSAPALNAEWLLQGLVLVGLALAMVAGAWRQRDAYSPPLTLQES